MLFGSKRKKSLFDPQSIPTGGAPAMQDMQPGLGMLQPEQSGGIGTRLLGEGWEAKAAALGSALQGNGAAIPQYHAQQQAIDQRSQLLAEQQRQQALMLTQRGQQQRDLIDYRAKVEGAQGPKPGSFEWYQSATPQERATYDQYNPFVVSTGQGPVAVPRRPGVGTKVNIKDLGPATIRNTPAPETNAQGDPNSLTRAQYQATVNAMGKAATDAYLQRHGIKVGS